MAGVIRYRTQEVNRMRTRFTILVVGVLTALALVAVPTVSAKTNVHTATLNGSSAFPAVHGSAKFGVDDGVRELEAEIQDAKRLAGKTLAIRVSGVLVGHMTVSSLGNASFHKRSNSLPAVTSGTPIRIRKADGTLVASGRFS